ncbi:MAG: efflux RND transporter periplasmic adaptor subunit [Chloroflexi bacterium]|nr:efflux RND transporter periplasmic adaptor subunit [Chloroflexota bacterium]
MQKTFLQKISVKTIFITFVTVSAIITTVVLFARPTTSEAAATPALQTAKVRTGDLIVTASGAGTVVPSAQVGLGFRANGMVAEVNVMLGQQVKAGDTLAYLNDAAEQIAFSQAEANLKALFSPAGIAEYQIGMVNAQDAYDTAVFNLQYYISPDVYYWETKTSEARHALDILELDPNATELVVADAQKVLGRAEYSMKAAQIDYINVYAPTYFTYTWIDEITLEEMAEVVPPSPSEVTLARATLEQTRLALTDAQRALEIVQNGDSAMLAQSLSAADGTALANIKAIYLAYENSRLALEGTRLVAPFDGSVIALDVVKGQTVGTLPVMTIATTDHLLVRFYLDETDLDKVAVGNQVTFMFDAYQNQPVDGEVVVVEPTLQVVDGTPVIVVWASLPTEPGFSLMSGMTVDAEVIAGESLKTLIVPVQALRELAPGSYAVFIVDANGQLVMTPVTVGLRDFANAEIVSGVKAGDVVSTGTVETK